jgi:putative hydrolase of the HAD superfamily
MTTAVYVDCDGTLLTLAGSYADLFATACDRVGVEADPGPLSATYSERFFEAFEAFAPDPYLSGVDAAFDHHGVEADSELFAEALVDAEVEATVVDEGASEALERLAADASLGVLTNGVADLQRRKLEHHGLFERFDAYLPSYEVGSHKPSPEIFEAARERLDAEGYVYVGDSMESDIRPARDAGFLPVHLDRTSEAGAVTVDGLSTLGRTAELF